MVEAVRKLVRVSVRHTTADEVAFIDGLWDRWVRGIGRVSARLRMEDLSLAYQHRVFDEGVCKKTVLAAVRGYAKP
jgi:ribosomal protein L31E